MILLEKHLSNYFGLLKEDVKKVSSLFVKEELKKEDYFLNINQYCDKFSFIESGFIRIFKNHKNKEITQWISSKDYFITELNSFVFGQRSRLHMQAISDCVLYTITKNDYEKLNILISNWNEIEKQFISHCFITLEDRVFNHLSLTTEERYDAFFKENKELFNHVPLQYIASMLGMSPETLSRIRSRKIN